MREVLVAVENLQFLFGVWLDEAENDLFGTVIPITEEQTAPLHIRRQEQGPGFSYFQLQH